MRIAEALKRAVVFCIQPKRWLPFFIIDLTFLSVALALVLSNVTSLLYLVSGITDISIIGPAAAVFFGLLALLIGWGLVNIWMTEALIHQSHKEKEFRESWPVSFSRYLSLLGVTAIAGIIAFVVSLVPYVGWLFAIFTGLVFFFSMQGVIVRRSGFMEAIEDSVNIFSKNPFRVFAAWLLILGISLILLGIFALPLLALIFSILIEAAAGGIVNTATVINAVFAIQSQLPMLVITGIIALVGLAISRAFSIKAQTEFYLQFRKAKAR